MTKCSAGCGSAKAGNDSMISLYLFTSSRIFTNATEPALWTSALQQASSPIDLWCAFISVSRRGTLLRLILPDELSRVVVLQSDQNSGHCGMCPTREIHILCNDLLPLGTQTRHPSRLRQAPVTTVWQTPKEQRTAEDAGNYALDLSDILAVLSPPAYIPSALLVARSLVVSFSAQWILAFCAFLWLNECETAYQRGDE